MEPRGSRQSNRVLDRLQGGSSRKFSRQQEFSAWEGGSVKIWNITCSVTAFHSKKKLWLGSQFYSHSCFSHPGKGCIEYR